MNRKRSIARVATLPAFILLPTALASPGAELTWKQCLNQDAAWYHGADAVRIAENVMLHQRASGGWPKNTDFARRLDDSARAEALRDKDKNDSTIDNGATRSELLFLARVFAAQKQEDHRAVFLRGLDYLLKAQYPNGGWPQFYPRATGYHRYITFNDDAMVGVLRLLRDVAQPEPPFGFVEPERRARCERAVARGVECILKCQVVVKGERTVWCAQHDEQTLAPASARSYEKISLSGSESVGVVEFLMGIQSPGPEVIDAIQSAVAWFDRVKITGFKVLRKPDESLPKGYDKVVVPEAGAPPLWARFYEIGTNRPMFCGRDGVVKHSLAEIEHERRIGYAWYVDAPARLLERDYPAWQAKWAPGRNVLAKPGP